MAQERMGDFMAALSEKSRQLVETISRKRNSPIRVPQTQPISLCPDNEMLAVAEMCFCDLVRSPAGIHG
jgi:hypothetical protein